MSKNSREIHAFKLSESVKDDDQTRVEKKLVVELFYQKEGKRGLYLSIAPETIESEPNSRFQTRIYTGYSGSKCFVHPMNRFSAKKLAEYKPSLDHLKTLMEDVCVRNGIGQPDITTIKQHFTL